MLFVREICHTILEKHSDEYQLGTSRVFLRESLERHLERERAAILNTAAITLQRNVRGFLARTQYTVKRQSAIKLQASVRGWMQRRRYETLRRGVVRAQATFRGRRQRKRYNQLKACIHNTVEAHVIYNINSQLCPRFFSTGGNETKGELGERKGESQSPEGRTGKKCQIARRTHAQHVRYSGGTRVDIQ